MYAFSTYLSLSPVRTTWSIISEYTSTFQPVFEDRENSKVSLNSGSSLLTSAEFVGCIQQVAGSVLLDH